MSAYTTNSHDSRTLTSKTSDNDDGRTRITPEGRGEGCRSCHSQIDIRHVLGDDGRYVMLCADWRAIYTDGDGGRQ